MSAESQDPPHDRWRLLIVQREVSTCHQSTYMDSFTSIFHPVTTPHIRIPLSLYFTLSTVQTYGFIYLYISPFHQPTHMESFTSIFHPVISSHRWIPLQPHVTAVGYSKWRNENLYAKKPTLWNNLPSKPAVGKNRVMYAPTTTRHFFFIIFAFPVHSITFFANPL